jgi:hypothetical protein
MASWIRVPLPEYRDNIQEMIRLVRGSGAGAILLYNELETESPYLEGLREVAAESNAPLIDSSALIDAERRRIEAAHSERLGVSSAGLKTGPQDAVDVLFRVRQGERQLPNGLFITGNHSSLANGEPNILPMSDDGSNGDERAGDGLWSYQARFEPGTRVAYVYTNGGVAGRWLGLDVPAIRRTRAPESTGHVLYRPIESFGQITLQADSWHTDATGYALISEAILEAFREIPDFRRRIDAGRDEAHSR